MIQQKFFDAAVLQQSIDLAESMDRFHFFMNAGQLEQAKEEISKVAATDTRAFVFKNMYWLESQRGSEEGQVYAARRLVDSDPSVDNLYLLGKALAGAGSEREALDVYHQIVDQSHEPTWMLFTIYKAIGNLYLKAKDFEATEEYYNRAYTINSDDLHLLLAYGYLYLHSERLSEAKERFAQIIARDADFCDAYIGLALVHSSVGEFDLACANIAHVLDREPNHKMALFLYYSWADKTESTETPLVFINNFLKDHPTDEEVITWKIGWHIKSQNFKKAYETLPILKKNFTGNSRHLAQLENYLRDVV